MEVKKGYKKTKIGVIPEDWTLISVDKNFEFYQNNTYSRDCMNDESGKIQNIHYGDILIKYGSILDCDKENIPFLNLGISVNYSNRTVQSGDIIIADTAEDNTVGKAIEVINTNGRKVVSGLHTIFIRPHAGLFAKRYLGYFFNAPIYHDQLLPYIVGIKVSSISKKTIRNTMILHPSLDEQQALATALSDADKLINSLVKLIKKKKNIKQGAIQELLTGKKRIKGIGDETKYASLSSLCNTFCDGDWIESKDQSDEGYRLVQTGNIGVGRFLDKSDKKRYVSRKTFERLNCTEIFYNDILVSRLPEPAGRACLVPDLKKPMITAVDCTIIRFTNYNPVLFVNYSQTFEYQKQISMMLGGSTRQRISRKELGKISIPFFASDKEQTAIANILSDMDAEIEALEQKLNKYKSIKQGMMQELLTGRIRLV